ncbi:MAG: hypothetical protein Q8O34_07125 [Rhodocyclaceae bacterium]|nr:hypothetical protein [Rhodocyclaceae bacterium]
MTAVFGRAARAGVLLLAIMPFWASAEINKGTHLGPKGQSKVNRAMAKGYGTSGVEGMQQNQSQVNIGSKRAGTCTMNVGATSASDKNSKEVIVTSKEIINICK